MKLFLVTLVFSFLASVASAASVSGVVTEDSGKGLEGVNVSIANSERATTTGADGRFQFEGLQAGQYTVVISKLGYKRQTKEISVTQSEVLVVDFFIEVKPISSVVDQVFVLDELVVVAEYEEEETTNFLGEESQVTLVQGVSREDFENLDIGNAAEAVSTISGAIIVDGKRPVIRGLDDRYIPVTYNGAPVVSDDSNKKGISLSVFPTGVLEDVSVTKIYNGGITSDFGGGSIDIISRTIPDEPVLSLSFATEIEDNNTDDFLLPRNLDLGVRSIDIDNFDAIFDENASLSENGRAFLNNDRFLPETVEQGVNTSWSLAWADKAEIGDWTFGAFLNVGVSESFDLEPRTVQRGLSEDPFEQLYFENVTSFRNYYSLSANYSDRHVIGYNSLTTEQRRGSYQERLTNQNGPTSELNSFDDGSLFGRPSLFTGTQTSGNVFDVNILEIEQLYGSHLLWGSQDESHVLLDWSATRSSISTEIQANTLNALVVSFNDPGLAEFTQGIDPVVFVDDTANAVTVREIAQSNFGETSLSIGGFVITIPGQLDSAQINGLNSFRDLFVLLNAEGIDPTGVATTFAEIVNSANQIANDVDPNFLGGEGFSTDNGDRPLGFGSTREFLLQFEEKENYRADLTFNYKKKYWQAKFKTGFNREDTYRTETYRNVEFDYNNFATTQASLDAFLDDISNNLIDSSIDSSSGTPVFNTGVLPNIFQGTGTVSEIRNIELFQTIDSGYGDVELTVNPVTLRSGYRREYIRRQFEATFIDVSSEFESDVESWGHSLAYDVGGGITLIAGASSSISRPLIKELVPVTTIDTFSGLSSQGSFELQDSRIRSHDLTVSYRPGGNFSSTFSLFQKEIDLPVFKLGNNLDEFVANGDNASIRGLEFEFDYKIKNGWFLKGSYANILGNIDYNPREFSGLATFEDADLSTTLPNQPGYTANAVIGYSGKENGLDMSLSYNIAGSFFERLPTASTGFALNRISSPKLDFVISKKATIFGIESSVGLSIKNLLRTPDILRAEFPFSNQASFDFEEEILPRAYKVFIKASF